MKRVVLIIIAAVMICAAVCICCYALGKKDHKVYVIRREGKTVRIDTVVRDGRMYVKGELPEEKPIARPEFHVEKKGITDKPIPAEHIQDRTIYETSEVIFNRYILYRHYVSPARDGKQEDKRITRGVNGDSADHFAWLFFQSPLRFKMKFGLKESRTLPEGFALDRYDINDAAKEYKRRAHLPADYHFCPCLEVLRDGKRVVWASSGERLINAQRSGQLIAVITDKGVYYVSAGKNRVVSDVYLKDFKDFGNRVEGIDLGAARMLTDNIVRIKYTIDERDARSNVRIAHWRIKLTRKDCEKNLRSLSFGPGESDDYANAKSQKMRASIIWSDSKAGISLFDKAWDFDTDTSHEPDYGK